MRVARGQALALFALTLLLLTLMVLMTVGIGMAATRRTDLNNAADAAAFSAAVETARTFNSAALLNRAIIAHYVTIAGIEAQMAYVTWGHNAFNMAGLQFRMFDMRNGSEGNVSVVDAMDDPTTPGGWRCEDATWEVRDASYEMWHAALFYMSPNPEPRIPGDNVRGYCNRKVNASECTRDRSGPLVRGDGWLLENGAKLEERAADELKAVHDAIHDLASIERATYKKLYTNLKTGDLADDVLAAAKLQKNSSVEGEDVARGELNAATRSDQSGGSYKRWQGFEHGFADAVMGSRPPEKLLLPGNPTNQDNFAPLFKDLRDFANQAFADYPGQPFQVAFSRPDITSDFTYFGQDNEQDKARRLEEPVTSSSNPASLDPGMGEIYGRAQTGNVVTTYYDACAQRRPRTLSSGHFDPLQVDAVTGQRMYTLPMGVMIRSSGDVGFHKDYASDHGDGFHWGGGAAANGMGCHGQHKHYNATDVNDVHKLNDDTLPKEILGFVLPSPAGSDGAHGLWGQPVLPIYLTKTFPLKGDPWALKFRFGFTQAGAELDMKQNRTMNAAAAGVAHYHRRGHLGEPPNLLNPFWRATLQPMEIDHRPKRMDPTYATEATTEQLMQVLNDDPYPEAAEARKAYGALAPQIRGMEEPPGNQQGVR